MKLLALLVAGAVAALALTNPPRLSFVTYLGPWSWPDPTQYTAADKSGAMYVSGITEAPWFPCNNEPVREPRRGVVTKLRPGGDGLFWTACLPGYSAGVAADEAGAIYVVSNLDGTATISKLRSADGKVIWERAIPMAKATALTVDREGSVYVTGGATAGMATTAGVYQRTRPGCPSTAPDCSYGFVVKLGPAGTVEFASYTETRGGFYSIAVDSKKAILLAGPVLLKLSANAISAVYSAYFVGGRYGPATLSSYMLGLALDAQDAAYVAGWTETLDPIATPGVVQPTPPSGPFIGPRGFAWKLDAAGKTVYRTYVGEISSHIPFSIAVDGEGNAFLGIQKQSQRRHCRTNEGVMVLNADATRIIGGGAVGITPRAMSMDGKGGVYVVGVPDIPPPFLATAGAPLFRWPGSSSVVASKVDFSQAPSADVDCIVNAATLAVGRNSAGANGSVAPGEIVTVFGLGLPAGEELRVEFDGTPAPILYADTAQINAIVPMGLDVRNSTTTVWIRTGTQSIGPLPLPLAVASPGVFILGGEGIAALHPDGRVNSSENPAAPGSVITVFVTGAGLYDVPMGDGTLGPMAGPFPAPQLPVSALVNRIPAEVLFAGQAPGMVAGVVQVNLRIPESLPAGKFAIDVHVGPYSTPLDRFVEVR